MAVFNRHLLLNLFAGMLAGVAASACCAGPLLAISLGLGGAWLGSLTAMEPLRPLFMAVTVVLFSLAFHRLYLSPMSCAAGEPCVSAAVRRRQRLVFWVVLLPVAAVVAFPWYAAWFY